MNKLTSTPTPLLLLLLCCGTIAVAASNVFQRSADTNLITSSSPYNVTGTHGPSIEYVYNNSGFSVEKLGDLVSPTLARDQIPVSISGIPDYEGAARNDTTIFFAAKIQEVVPEPVDEKPCAGRDCKVPPNHTYQIWSYNNDNSKLMLLCEVPGQSPNAPIDLIPFQSKLYFRGDIYDGSMQVWACDQDANGEAELIYKTNGTQYGQVRQLELFNDMLFFTGYVDEAAYRGNNMTLFVSDGTPEGTEEFLPGWRIGSFETPKKGMSTFAFTVISHGTYITDGTPDGTQLFLDRKDFPRGAYAQSISSEPFHGDKYLFLLQHNQTMVTNWVDLNTTIMLLDGFELRDSMKLNDTHMIFGGLDMQKRPSIYITDGTVNGTHHLWSEDVGEFYLTRKYGPNSIHLAHIIRLGRGGFNTTTYITNGTLEGTQEVQGWPRIRSQVTTYLPDGRSIMVDKRNKTDNTTRFRISDFIHNQYTFVEDVSMPSIGGENGYYNRRFTPIGNDTVVFFACHDANGCTPWKITYPPRKRSTDYNASHVGEAKEEGDDETFATSDNNQRSRAPETTAAPTTVMENPPSVLAPTPSPTTGAPTTATTIMPTTAAVTSGGIKFSATWCASILWGVQTALMIIVGF